MSDLSVLDAAHQMNQKGVLTMATQLGLSAPISVKCLMTRVPSPGPNHVDDKRFTNWPGNIDISVARYYVPETRADLIAAILDSEKNGYRVRALGAQYSFSDVVLPIRSAKEQSDAEGIAAAAATKALAAAGADPVKLRSIAASQIGVPKYNDALIDTSKLNGRLDDLSRILLKDLPDGVHANRLFHVCAGVGISTLNGLLDGIPGDRQALDTTGGASNQTLAGAISTGTHGAESQIPPLADQIMAIHLIAAGGVEYWIEPSVPITDPDRVIAEYPCLSRERVIYDDQTFRAVLVSIGSMGIIYSLIVRTIAQYGAVQHRARTNWAGLKELAGSRLQGVIDGTLMQTLYLTPGATGTLVEAPWLGQSVEVGSPALSRSLGPFLQPSFSQIVINPYLNPDEPSAGYSTRVTNRVRTSIPADPFNPSGSLNQTELLTQVGRQVNNTLQNESGDPLDKGAIGLNFKAFSDQLTQGYYADPAASFIDFLAHNNYGHGMFTLIEYILEQAMPVGDRTGVSMALTDVFTWGSSIKALSVEAAFSMENVLGFVDSVLDLVKKRLVDNVLIGGYLSLRIVGRQTAALLGMQRFTPTCFVEYAMLGGTVGIDAFVDELQHLALVNGGILHWGQCNNVMSQTDLERIYGEDLNRFREVRKQLRGGLATFDNLTTERFSL